MGRPMKFETGAAVEKAMDLFWLQGYAGTSPQQLCSEMGIGRGSLYNTFESKHALFVRTLERYSQMRLDYLAELLVDTPGPIRPRLRQAMAVLSGAGDHRRGCVMVNAAAELGAADAEVNRIADQLFAGITSAFDRAIRLGRATGELTGDEPPEVAAHRLLATVIGLSVLVKSGGRAEDSASIVDAVVATL